MTSFVVGRATNVDIPLQDRTISSQHLRIEQEGAVIYITDLKSTNGTFVCRGIGKMQIQGRQQVEVLDQLLLGTYAISVADLIARIPIVKTQEENNGLSRYLRADNGTYIGKK